MDLKSHRTQCEQPKVSVVLWQPHTSTLCLVLVQPQAWDLIIKRNSAHCYFSLTRNKKNSGRFSLVPPTGQFGYCALQIFTTSPLPTNQQILPWPLKFDDRMASVAEKNLAKVPLKCLPNVTTCYTAVTTPKYLVPSN